MSVLLTQVLVQCTLAQGIGRGPFEFDGELVSKNFYFNRDMNFAGVFGGERIYFDVDDHWIVKSAVLNLSLTQSELLDESVSTLTVYVNDRPAHSINIKADESRKNSNTISIPLDYLKTGNNELKIYTYKRISDKPCVDDVNNGNWVLIHDTSYIHLEFNEQKASNLISEYPYPFLKASGSMGAGKSLIMIPDDPDEEEISAALQVAAGFGSLAKGEDVDIGISKYSQLNENDRKNWNIIFVGKLKNLPREILDITPQEVFQKAGEGALIYKSNSPYGSMKKLMCLVTGRDDGMLDMASKLLYNTDMTSQIETDVCFIEKDADIYIKKKEISSNITLKDLGYNGGIYMKGPFRQQTTIGIKLPKNKQVQPGAKISLNIRYSKNLDFNRSLATVFVNGVPVGSKKLELMTGDGDTLEVTIPNDITIGSYIEIKIAFDLEVPEMYCSFRQDEMPWGFIAEDSSVYMPTKDENAFLFENYPWPFIKDGTFNNVTVVLPDEIPVLELDMLFDMFAQLGGEIDSNTGTLRVVRDSDFKDRDKDSNIIMIGAPENFKNIKEMNDSQWFKYDNSFSYFLSNEKRRLMKEFSSNLASIQLFASPFNKDRGILMVTSPKKENMINVRKYLTSSKLSLVGNASLVDRWGDITNHYFISSNSDKPSVLERLQGSQVKIFIILFGTVMFLLVISILMYMRKHRRKR